MLPELLVGVAGGALLLTWLGLVSEQGGDLVGQVQVVGQGRLKFVASVCLLKQNFFPSFPSGFPCSPTPNASALVGNEGLCVSPQAARVVFMLFLALVC